MPKKYLGMQKVSFQTIELCEGDGENREGRHVYFHVLSFDEDDHHEIIMFP